MTYWWVSHNSTYKEELGGGYLWAPKVDKNGRRIHHWDTMLQVRPGDIIFSFANTYIQRVGIALSEAYDSLKPPNWGKTGEAWGEDGRRVDVEFSRVNSLVRPRDNMRLLADLLPEKYSPIKEDGDGNQGYLYYLPDSFGSVLLALTGNTIPDMPVLSLDQIEMDTTEQEIILDDAIRETEKATLVLARRGQGLFRNRVANIESSCRVTGLSESKFLIASHIKPWAKSDNAERVDGNNGLFLSPHVDKLFNDGFITFTQKGRMNVSPLLPLGVLEKWNIDPTADYGTFNSDQAYFLEFHHSNLFKE